MNARQPFKAGSSHVEFERIKNDGDYRRSKGGLNEGLSSEVNSFDGCFFCTVGIWIFFLCICKDMDFMALIVMVTTVAEDWANTEVTIKMFVIYACLGFVAANGWLASSARKACKDKKEGKPVTEGTQIYERVEWFQFVPMLGVLALLDFYSNERDDDLDHYKGNEYTMMLKEDSKKKLKIQAAKLQTLLYINNAYLISVTLPQVIIVLYRIYDEARRMQPSYDNLELHLGNLTAINSTPLALATATTLAAETGKATEIPGDIASLFTFFMIFATMQAILSIMSATCACMRRGCTEKAQMVLKDAKELTLKQQQEREERQKLLNYYLAFMTDVQALYMPIYNEHQAMLERYKKSHPKLFSSGKRHILNVDAFGLEFIRQIYAGDIMFLQKVKCACKNYVDMYDEDSMRAKPEIWREKSVLDAIKDRDLHELNIRDAWAWLKSYQIIAQPGQGLDLDSWFDGRQIELDLPVVQQNDANDLPAYTGMTLAESLQDFDDDMDYSVIVNMSLSIYEFFIFLEQLVGDIQLEIKLNRDLIANKSGSDEPVGKAEHIIKLKNQAMKTTFPSEKQIVHINMVNKRRKKRFPGP